MSTIEFNQKRELIKKQTVFSKLNTEELDELTGLFFDKKFKSGEVIVNEGDAVDSIFLIINGLADVRHVNFVEQSFQSVAELGPGQAIGLNETGFYSLSGLRTATVVAIVDTDTICLKVSSFHGFALAHPHVSEIMRRSAMTFIDSGSI